MMVRYWNSAKHDVSFLGIPKTGSSTVRATLGMHPEKDWTLSPTFSRTFTVLRHPVARIKSAYQECRRRGTLRHPSHSFSEFIRSIEKHGFFDEHTVPMRHYFEPVQRVFTLEDMTNLWQWLGIDDVKLANVSPTYDVEIGDEEMQIIKRLYEDDLWLYEEWIDNYL